MMEMEFDTGKEYLERRGTVFADGRNNIWNDGISLTGSACLVL